MLFLFFLFFVLSKNIFFLQHNISQIKTDIKLDLQQPKHLTTHKHHTIHQNISKAENHKHYVNIIIQHYVFSICIYLLLEFYT